MIYHIYIQNLKCGGCASTIKRKLANLKGVLDVEVEVEKSEVALELEADHFLLNVKAALRLMGYPTIGEENSISTKAKSYVSCATGRLIQH